MRDKAGSAFLNLGLFSDALLKFRVKRGLSQKALAAMTSVSSSYISLLEAGKRPVPKDGVVEELDQALGANGKLAMEAKRELLFFSVILGDRELVRSVFDLCSGLEWNRVKIIRQLKTLSLGDDQGRGIEMSRAASIETMRTDLRRGLLSRFKNDPAVHMKPVSSGVLSALSDNAADFFVELLKNGFDKKEKKTG